MIFVLFMSWTIHSSIDLAHFIIHSSSPFRIYFSIILQMEARFFASLSTSEDLKKLAVFVSDPDVPTTKIRQLYVYCRGTPTEPRFKVLNTALIYFSTTFVQLKYVNKDLSDINLFVKAQYQPNTCAFYFRCLFAIFNTHSVRFTLAKSFNGIGTFCPSH